MKEDIEQNNKKQSDEFRACLNAITDRELTKQKKLNELLSKTSLSSRDSNMDKPASNLVNSYKTLLDGLSL